ncbi:hypothetical protein [Paraburkholderia strydomiana]|uniref:hypothetical protein n=1 Tax=Paraburkholderia strydomiana TaxID=1245417 RepID=UPI001BEA8CF0|nr:hypothetical protein [Paraburkholderia strydomiana]MBT2794580.1 hypothetical protein [Paraburkholderia strydomiana]
MGVKDKLWGALTTVIKMNSLVVAPGCAITANGFLAATIGASLTLHPNTNAATIQTAP